MKKAIIFTVIFILFCAKVAICLDSDTIKSKEEDASKSRKLENQLKNYLKAITNDPNSAELNFNIGDVYFKQEEFEKAKNYFQRSLLTDDKPLEAKANYNLANSQYKIADASQGKELGKAVDELEQALAHYRRSIELDTKDKEAKVNYELAEKKYKELKEKLKQQGGGKQQKQGKDSDKQQQDKEKQAGGQGQQNSKNDQEENKSQQSPEQKQKEEKQPQPQESQQDEKEMSAQEAKMLLDGFRQEENSFGKLDDTKKSNTEESQKDW